MRRPTVRSRRVCGWLIPLALALVWLMAALPGQAAAVPHLASIGRPCSPDLAATFTFSGRVYEGAPYDQTHPLANVTITLYGSNNSAQGVARPFG